MYRFFWKIKRIHIFAIVLFIFQQDPKDSLDFYTRVLGMTLLAVLPFPSMKFTLYFLGKPKSNICQISRSILPRASHSSVHNYSSKHKLYLMHRLRAEGRCARGSKGASRVDVWPPRRSGAYAQLGNGERSRLQGYASAVCGSSMR